MQQRLISLHVRHIRQRVIISSPRMPLLQDLLKQQSKGSVNFDDLFKNHVLGGKVEELAQTIDVLKNTNPQAVANINSKPCYGLATKSVNRDGGFSSSRHEKSTG